MKELFYEEDSSLTVGDVNIIKSPEGRLVMKEKDWVVILLEQGWNLVDGKGYLRKYGHEKLVFSKMSKL